MFSLCLQFQDFMIWFGLLEILQQVLITFTNIQMLLEAELALPREIVDILSG